jgi:hypothetical protein
LVLSHDSVQSPARREASQADWTLEAIEQPRTRLDLADHMLTGERAE